MIESKRETSGLSARALEWLCRLVLRTSRGPLRSVWALAYLLLTRAYVFYVVRGERQPTAYLRGGMVSADPIYGLSDVDLAFVLSADLERQGAARERVRQRSEKVSRALPRLGQLFDTPFVFEDSDLHAAASPILTYQLESGPGGGAARSASAYHGPSNDPDRLRLQMRPELSGPTREWRTLAGSRAHAPPIAAPLAGGVPAGARSAVAADRESHRA